MPGVSYAVVTRDATSIVGAAGYADAQAKSPALDSTLFEAASIAKLVIAVAVMQLVDEKKLDLDVPVATYVPFPVANPATPRGPAITLRHLLTHTSSIADRDGELLVTRDQRSLGDFLREYLVVGNRPRNAAYDPRLPGEAMRYSNVGAALAAYVVERVAGQGFDAYTRQRIFAPLAMTHTRWTGTARDPDLATPHALRDGGQTPRPQPAHAVYPVVDLRSTASDLGRFARAMLRGGELDGARILGAASAQAMMAAPGLDGGDASQALVWQIRTFHGRRVLGHEGEDEGASTGLYLDPAAGLGAIVLANGDAFSGGEKARADAMLDLFARLFDLIPSRHAD